MKPLVNSSPLAQIIRFYQDALNALEIRHTPEQLESWCLGIHFAMNNRSRAFHQSEHILEVARGLQPLQVLAALYHDTVYYQVDHEISPHLQDKVKNVLVIKDGRFFVPKEIQDAKLRLVRDVFDFNPEQELNVYGGMNEYLSATVAISDLGALLTNIQIAALAACVRATIPFQGKDSSGKSFPERITATLTRLSNRDGWNCPAEQIDEMTLRAVEMGNRDVSNFGHEDLAVFLDNTWKLLAEGNSALSTLGAYTIKTYRASLMKMEGFLKKLDPNLVFHEYKNFPAHYASWQQAAGINIEQAVGYLQVKLLSAIMLEAIAELTGGDAPVALLAGATKETDSNAKQIQDFLKSPENYRTPKFSGVNHRVYRLLNEGRTAATSFDSKASPLSAFIYSILGDASLRSHFAQAQKAVQGEILWLDFLKSFPNSLGKEMVEAVAQLCEVRSERCLKLAKQLGA